MRRVILVLATVFFAACGPGGSSYQDVSVYYTSMEKLTVKVVYEADAAPNTGVIGSGSLSGIDYWDILKLNLESLFVGRTPTVSVTVPHTLAEMTSIASTGKVSWTLEEIETLAASHLTASTNTHSHFVVLFIRGYFNQDGETQPTMIGLNIGGTPIVAVFKDVIDSAATSAAVKRFMEQSTLVHEMGHALGLLDNGVRMTAEHHDAANPKHCSNDACVMYYLNAGVADLIDFITAVAASGSVVMFGTECLNDTRTYKP